MTLGDKLGCLGGEEVHLIVQPAERPFEKLLGDGGTTILCEPSLSPRPCAPGWVNCLDPIGSGGEAGGGGEGVWRCHRRKHSAVSFTLPAPDPAQRKPRPAAPLLSEIPELAYPLSPTSLIHASPLPCFFFCPPTRGCPNPTCTAANLRQPGRGRSKHAGWERVRANGDQRKCLTCARSAAGVREDLAALETAGAAGDEVAQVLSPRPAPMVSSISSAEC